MNHPQVLLIDAHAIIHRSFHALPPLTGPRGEPVGALYGLARVLLKVLRNERFTHLFAAFDRPEPTFRKEAFEGYKAHRPKAPDELVAQLEGARELFRALVIAVVEQPGFEADDIIGTLAERFSREGASVTILTGDFDALQLVRDPMVAVETFKKGVSEMARYDEAAVHARYGFAPVHIPDWKGIAGDASDNIPGIPGIGSTTATRLVSAYGGLDDMYRALARQSVEEFARTAGVQTRFANALAAHEKDARFSKMLATIRTDVPLALKLAEGHWGGTLPPSAETYFARMGFESILRRRNEAARPARGPELFEPPGGDTDAVFISGFAEAAAKFSDLASEREKVAYDWKNILKSLGDRASQVKPPIFDLAIAGWLIDPDQKNVAREALLARFSPPNARSVAAPDAALYRTLAGLLESHRLTRVFREIEMPLVPILAAMELRGIAVDPSRLSALTEQVRANLARLERSISDAAGASFNLNSPQQVAEILFEKLGLATAKARKTKTGKRRTNRDVLLELKGAHPVVPLLLEYREDFKILSSFLEPLIEAANGGRRVHSTFLQTGTATGRLASADPNLQNIPQESRWAPALRRAFVASAGMRLASFDYSQLELRLLAHVSGDSALRRAFHEGADIHRTAAAAVFGVAPDAVTPAMRRTAKTLNFGIVYGMGVRAFAAASGLPPPEAKRFIEEYFRTFPRVREWQESVKAEARARGYVTNENGRRRWFHEAAVRGRLGEAERAAINMPLQSLGADIIKIAMIKTAPLLAPPAAAVLSVHDELLFEIPEGMLSTLVPAVRGAMESAATLEVPLRVDVRVGDSWGTMETIA